MNELISIIEDEKDIAELIKINLLKTGFRVKDYPEAKPFLDDPDSGSCDLLILDLMLPDMDGIELCRKLKSEKQTASIPIIMLTARAEEIDRVLGLEIGADDYVTKPFSPRELVARVKAVLRRGGKIEDKDKEADKDTNSICIGNILTIDTEKCLVSIREKRIALTTSEYKILIMLAQKPGWVFSREKILDSVWGYEKAVTDRTVDVHIRNLREKLGEAEKFIQNVRGMGYKLEE